MVDLSDDGLAKTSALVSAANPKCVTRLISADVANAEDLERLCLEGTSASLARSSCVLQQRGYRRARELEIGGRCQSERCHPGDEVGAMRGKMGSAKTSSSDRVVVNVASAGGVFPMLLRLLCTPPRKPRWFCTRAIPRASPHKTHGVRVNALCPQFTDTALVQGQFQAIGEAVPAALLAQTGGELLTVEQVVDAAMELVRDETKAGGTRHEQRG